jgi:hypothetical protein
MNTSVNNLREKLRACVEALLDASVDEVEAAVDAVSDLMACGEKTDDLVLDSVLDGLRFGKRAAAAVELGGGMMIRLRAPGGFSITHEWAGRLSEERRETLMQAFLREIVEASGRGND